MQVITELYQGLGHLMRVTEGLATRPNVNKKAVRQSVAAERAIKKVLQTLGQKQGENE